MSTVKLSAPWVSYYRKIQALFGADPDIRTDYDEENQIIRLYVNGQDKASAITQLLPIEKEFGNVTVDIEVIPANTEPSQAVLFRKAFEGNPALSYIATVEGIMTNPLSYVVFRNQVVQYWNDNLGDVNGNCSTLYQELAKEVIGNIDGIFYCTDEERNLGKPVRKEDQK